MAKTSINLGKVSTTPKGEYNNETNYVRLDIVAYNGSSYVCLTDCVGVVPTNTTYWQILAIKGEKGDTGEKGEKGDKGETGEKGATGNDGHTPVKGVDYFTQEDIKSLNIPSELSELSEDTTHRVVTDVEKETWNNKSDFSGSYNDLTDKPNIPSKTSDLTNDSGFITNSVNNLINYYLKNEVYTKEEVTQLIGAIQQFHYEVVQELPQTGANNIMYLVPKSTSQTNNVYDEYVYSNGWEKIGDTQIDLSNYVTITMLNQALADYTTTANLTTLLAGKQNVIDSAHKLDASLVDDSLSTNKFVTSAEKTTWNGKQDVLTAGTNITIDANNVISATGGGSSNQDVYVINLDNYNSSNPFIFAEHPFGRYYFYYKNTNPNLACKAKSTDSAVSYIYGLSNLSYIQYDVDLNNITKATDIAEYNKYFKNDNDGMYTQMDKIRYNPNNSATLSEKNGYAKIYYNTLSMPQTITAKKTYNVLPESSVTPTTNNQFVNKQYVDNLPTTYAGYDATKTQVLKNVNGTLTWVDES